MSSSVYPMNHVKCFPSFSGVKSHLLFWFNIFKVLDHSGTSAEAMCFSRGRQQLQLIATCFLLRVKIIGMLINSNSGTMHALPEKSGRQKLNTSLHLLSPIYPHPLKKLQVLANCSHLPFFLKGKRAGSIIPYYD